MTEYGTDMVDMSMPTWQLSPKGILVWEMPPLYPWLALEPLLSATTSMAEDGADMADMSGKARPGDAC